MNKPDDYSAYQARLEAEQQRFTSAAHRVCFHHCAVVGEVAYTMWLAGRRYEREQATEQELDYDLATHMQVLARAYREGRYADFDNIVSMLTQSDVQEIVRTWENAASRLYKALTSQEQTP